MVTARTIQNLIPSKTTSLETPAYLFRVLYCRIQEIATPARGVTSIKFITGGSRRGVAIRQQYYIVCLVAVTKDCK